MSPSHTIHVSVPYYSCLRPTLFMSPSHIIRPLSQITRVSVPNYSCLRPKLFASPSHHLCSEMAYRRKMVNRNTEKVFLLKGSPQIVRDFYILKIWLSCHLTNVIGRHLVICLQSLNRSIDVNVALQARCRARCVTVTALCSMGLERGKYLELTW